MLSTTEGAVKATLHRGRGRLTDPDGATALARRAALDGDTFDALAAAFTAYDLDRLTKVFVEDAVSDVIGTAHEVGRDQIAPGSLHHTLHLETSVRWRAEVRELDGVPLVLMWATPTDGDGPEAVEDLLSCRTAAVRWWAADELGCQVACDRGGSDSQATWLLRNSRSR